MQTIWYKYDESLFYYDKNIYRKMENGTKLINSLVDVREIIFTEDFMNKFMEYYKWPLGYNLMIWSIPLNCPSEYLYSLIITDV